MVTFISMYNDESFLSKKDLQKKKKALENAKRMKEAAKRKEKIDAIKRARKKQLEEQKKMFEREKQFALDLLKKLSIGKKMATVRAARCKRKRENVHEAEKVIKICKYFNMKYQGSRSRQQKYCFCKTAYDEEQSYISCDICEDWFHSSVCRHSIEFDKIHRPICMSCL